MLVIQGIYLKVLNNMQIGKIIYIKARVKNWFENSLDLR